MDTLTESGYLERIRITLASIEDTVDHLAEDLDCKSSDGLLTVIFPEGKQLIFNRQRAAHQLWLATPEQGLHFDFDTATEKWVDDKEGLILDDVLTREFSRLLGQNIVFDL